MRLKRWGMSKMSKMSEMNQVSKRNEISKINKLKSIKILCFPFKLEYHSPFAVLKKYAKPKGAGHFHHLLPYRFYDAKRGIFHNQYASEGLFSRQAKRVKNGYGFGLQLSPLTGANIHLAKDLNDMIVSKLPAGKKFSYQFSLLGHRQLLEKIQYNAYVHSKRGGMYADIANHQANLAIKALIDGFPSGYGKHAHFDLKDYEAYFFAHCIAQDASKMAQVKEDVEIALSTAQIQYQAMAAEDLMAHVGNIINHNPKKLTPSQYHHNVYDYLNQQVCDASTVIDQMDANYIDIAFMDETCGYGENNASGQSAAHVDKVVSAQARGQEERKGEKGEQDKEVKKAEVRVVCLSLKKLPSDFFMTQLPEFLSSSNNIGLSLRCPFLWTTNFQIEDKLKSDTQTRQKIKNLDKLRSIGFEKLLPFLSDELSEYRDIHRGLEDDRYRICTFSMDLILFSSKADYKKDVAAAMNLFRHGLQLQDCQYLQGQIFQSIFPFCYAPLSDDRQRSGTRHRTKSPNVVSFLPIVGDYKGAYDPDKGEHQGRSYGLITTTAKNQFAPLNLFKMGTDSYNVVIAGAKGSGKSVLAQLLIYQIVAMGGYAWAIDKGNSFRDLVEIVEGRHINAMELYLNPFSYLDLEQMESDPDLMNDPDIDVYSVYSNTISMIAELFYMIGKPKEKDVCPWQFAKLTQAVMLAHQQFTTNTKVDHVWDELKKMVDEQRAQNNGHCDTRLSDWLDLLKVYRTDSYSKTHSKIFNETSKLDPDSPFICVEVEGVSKEMINPLMMALSIDINNRIILSRDAKPKGFFIEEAPQIMRFESQTLQDKFSEAAATYRKKNASLAFIGQTVKELNSTSLLAQGYEKAAIKIIMSQDATFAAFAKQNKENPLFTDREIKIIQHFRPSSEAWFSSFLVKRGEFSSEHRFFLDPYSKIITSTKRQEVDAVKNYRKQGYALKEAIMLTVNEFYGDELAELQRFSEQFASLQARNQVDIDYADFKQRLAETSDGQVRQNNNKK